MKMNSHLFIILPLTVLGCEGDEFSLFLPNKLLFENLKPLFSETTFLPKGSEERDEPLFSNALILRTNEKKTSPMNITANMFR